MQTKFLPALKGFDLSKRKIPLMWEGSPNPGPTIWLCGAIHGDEVTGTEVIQRVFAHLKVEKLKKGKVMALPVMNPLGYEMASRVSPYDDEDLNRQFPGDPQGSTAERLANVIFGTITQSKPDLVIDLHTDTMSSIAYILVDRLTSGKEGIKVLQKSIEAAEVFGVNWFFDIPLVEYIKDHGDKTLSGALLNRSKIPSFTVELGGPMVVNEEFVRVGLEGVKNILRYLGMLAAAEPAFSYERKSFLSKPYRIEEKSTVNTSGMVEYKVRAGQMVKKGQMLARIKNVFGKTEEIYRASENALVLSMSDYSVVFPGSDLFLLAVEEK